MKQLDSMLQCINLCSKMIFVKRNMDHLLDLQLNNSWISATKILLLSFSFKIDRENNSSSINSEIFTTNYMETLINSMMQSDSSFTLKIVQEFNYKFSSKK